MRRSGGPSNHDDRCEQAPMLGVLSVLLLLIPSLVMMAQVTSYTAIHVGTPLHAAEGPPDHTIRCGRDDPLRVAIAGDGFYVRRWGHGWQRVGTSTLQYDHAALTGLVRAHKHQYPHETVAYVSAESDVPYQTLVATLDSIRGPSCRTADLWLGEDAPDDCLLWNPIIRDMRADHEVPGFRGGGTWPPRPPREVSAARGETSRHPWER